MMKCDTDRARRLNIGARAILFDFGLSEAAEKRVTQALWMLGILTVGYGLCLTWTITRNG